MILTLTRHFVPNLHPFSLSFAFRTSAMVTTRRSTRVATSVLVRAHESGDLDDPPRPAKRLKTVVARKQTTEEVVVAPSPIKKRRKSAGNAKEEPKPEDYRVRVSSPWKVGAHVSAAGGVENAIQNAAELG
jgi:AP endonuclease-1